MNQATLFDLTTTYAPPKSDCKQMCQELLADPDAVIIDTETTGLTQLDEVIQVAIVNMAGECLLESFVKPVSATIHPGAYEVHHISERNLYDAPTIDQLDLINILDMRMIVGYNIGFDARLLKQSAEAAQDAKLFYFLDGPAWMNLAQRPTPERACYFDMMALYARHWACPKKTGGYKWQSLDDACAQQGIRPNWKHQALDDARSTLALIKRLAEGPEVRWEGGS
jgi:DNA polymerase-3 subunit epsilon